MENEMVMQGVVLLVDDQPESIDVIKSALDKTFIIRVATRGELALKIVQRGDVDLVLLDVVMPGMDGFEVCRLLKQDPKTRDVPVIFLTSKESHEDEARGLALGAVDFIRKPSSPLVVLTRTVNTISHQRAKEELCVKNEELRETLTIREDMERISRHDLKGPLTGILGVPQILLADDNLTEGQKSLLRMLEQSGYLMLEMINRSLDLFKMENGSYQLQPEEFDLRSVMDRVIADLDKRVRFRKLAVHVRHSGNKMEKAPFPVMGERLLCYPLFYNLVLNAIQASPEEGDIGIDLAAEGGFASIGITNSGEVPLAIRDRFFEKYVTSGKEGGTGLGTYSASLAAKTQGGRIAVDFSKPGRTTITLWLPLPGE